MTQFTYKGLEIDGKIYKYNKKYRVAEVENNDCMYFLQKKSCLNGKQYHFSIAKN